MLRAAPTVLSGGIGIAGFVVMRKGGFLKDNKRKRFLGLSVFVMW